MTLSQVPAVQGPIAYLTGQYPRATDTFVQREVFEIRAHGVEVLTATIRKTGPEHHVGAEQIAEAKTTFAVLEATMRPFTSMVAHWNSLTRSPRRYFSALVLAARTHQPGFWGFLYNLVYFAEAVVLGDYLVRNHVKHLHNHIAEASCTVAMLASEITGIPFSFTMHGPYIFFGPKNWCLEEKISRSCFVCCITHFCRSQGMVFSRKKHWTRMHIIHCGVDPDLYGKECRAPGKNLLFVGRLAAVKGVSILLEALARVRIQHPDVRLTLVGDGEERKKLEELTHELGVSDIVEFVGFKSQTEVAEFFSTADVFVLPSFAEGLPVVLMEALASRVPVITTQIAGVSELVEHGINGFIVRPGDIDSLAEQIFEILEDPSLLSEMGEAGRARVVENFNIRSEVARLLHLIELYQSDMPPNTIRAPLPAWYSKKRS